MTPEAASWLTSMHGISAMRRRIVLYKDFS